MVRETRALKRHASTRPGSAVVALVFVSVAGLLVAASSSAASAGPQGIHKIKHVVVIMQENRSFDSYFGTFPGARGSR